METHAVYDFVRKQFLMKRPNMRRYLSSCLFAAALVYPLDFALLSSPVQAGQSQFEIITDFSAQSAQGNARRRPGGAQRPPGRPPGAQRPPGRPPGANRPPHRPPAVHRPPSRPHGNWSRPRRYSWRPGGAIAAGAALGFISAATAGAWAGVPPAPGLCWYYTDWTQTRGFWDVCP